MEAKKTKVLAIDDNRENLILLGAFLAEKLPEVILLAAQNGPEGLALAHAEDPDVILLDIMLPGMDGFEICQRLKDDVIMRIIPVVFLTALKTDQELRIRALEAGAEGFLSKPIEKVELIAQIRAMVIIKAVNQQKQREKEQLTDLVERSTQALQLEVDEHKQTEEALRKSEEWYRVMLLTAMDGFLMVDMQGRLLEVNAAYCRMSGYSEAELLAMHVSDLEVAESPNDITFRLEKIVAQGESRFEGWHRRKDGSCFAIDVSAQYKSDEGGRVVTFMRDITERKQAEAALVYERNRAQKYLNTVETIILALDGEGRITAINRKGCELFGAKEEELIGQNWFSHCLPQPDGMEKVYPEFLKLRNRESGAAEYFENLVVTQSGEKRQIAWHNVLLHDDQGRTIGTLSSGEDITLRKQAEESLRQSEETYRALIKGLPDIVMRFDREGRHLFVSDNVSKVQNLSAVQFIGKTHRELDFPEAQSLFWEQTIRTVFDTGTPFETEFTFEGKQGPMIYNWRMLPEHDEHGVIRSVLSLSRDITDRKQVQEECRQLEMQLQQAMKMEAIGRLAGGVAHDFNNALTPLMIISDTLLSELNPGNPMYEDIKEMQKSGERCATLTRQLLAFSRNQPLELTLLNLNDVIGNMVKMLSRIIGEDIELITVLDPELGNNMADVGQLEQILANFTVNARDAMPNGGKLTLETQNVTLDEAVTEEHVTVISGAYIKLTISDTGIGMDEATKAHIFEPFFTTKEKGKGTGLGLSTVYGIIKQSKGYIWVDSELGKGTAFKIYLPRVAGEVAKVKAPVRASMESLRGSETILLVEDEDSVRKTIKRILGEYGYTVLEASTGAQALEVGGQYSAAIPLIVADVVMPGMNGEEMVDRLLVSRPEIKALFISGYSDNAIVQAARLNKGTDFLQKPFTTESLTAKIRRLLDKV